MNNIKNKILNMFLSSGMALAVTACGGSSSEPVVATADFIAMAKNAECSEYSNRLFLIDQKNVFWDVAGNCPDRSPLRRFFGQSPNAILCTEVSSIAGPITTCSDEHARSLFTTIIYNLEKSDVGLGTSHQVPPIVFERV